MSESRLARRDFNNAEFDAYIRFYYKDGVPTADTAVSVWRIYECECGFRTSSSGEVFDHCEANHKPPKPEGIEATHV